MQNAAQVCISERLVALTFGLPALRLPFVRFGFCKFSWMVLACPENQSTKEHERSMKAHETGLFGK
jgi:hypothetical protein